LLDCMRCFPVCDQQRCRRDSRILGNVTVNGGRLQGSWWRFPFFPRLLSEIGKALYGEHWETASSRKIGVSDRSMRRWANGTDRVPWGVWFDVYREVEARVQNLKHWQGVHYDRVVIKDCEPCAIKAYDPKRDWRVEVHDPVSRDNQGTIRESASISRSAIANKSFSLFTLEKIENLKM
jgi:hypothetical protein